MEKYPRGGSPSVEPFFSASFMVGYGAAQSAWHTSGGANCKNDTTAGPTRGAFAGDSASAASAFLPAVTAAACDEAARRSSREFEAGS